MSLKCQHDDDDDNNNNSSFIAPKHYARSGCRAELSHDIRTHAPRTQSTCRATCAKEVKRLPTKPPHTPTMHVTILPPQQLMRHVWNTAIHQTRWVHHARNAMIGGTTYNPMQRRSVPVCMSLPHLLWVPVYINLWQMWWHKPGWVGHAASFLSPYLHLFSFCGGLP